MVFRDIRGTVPSVVLSTGIGTSSTAPVGTSGTGETSLYPVRSSASGVVAVVLTGSLSFARTR